MHKMLIYTGFMSALAKINKAPSLLLLFCIFLAAQGSSLVHEFDHLVTGDSSSCLICPLGSNVQAAASDSADLPAVTAPAATWPGRSELLGDDAFSIENSARGPPSSV